MAEHRRKVLEHFSGTLCVDELHLGRFTLLLATDPLSDLPVAFALVAANDQDHMRRFLQNLKNWGLNPEVVVTDGSNLYPAVLAELWPDADHQLCVFHVIKDINKLILDAVRRLRTAMSRRGKAGRKKKRGRKGAKSKAAAARRGLTVKEKAHFVFKHRHLIVKRRENLTESERDDLTRMLEYLPELATLAAVRRPDLLAVRHAQGLPPGELPPGRDRARPGVPGGAGVGQGDGAIGRGEVPQADGVPEEPGEPAGADQQPCGADQPDVPVPGEGAVQVAAAEDAGAVRGVEARRHLEPLVAARGQGQDDSPAERRQATQATTR